MVNYDNTATRRVEVESADELSEDDRVHVINTANGSAEVEGSVLGVDGDTVRLSICGVRTKEVTFDDDGTVSVSGAPWTFVAEVERDEDRSDVRWSSGFDFGGDA